MNFFLKNLKDTLEAINKLIGNNIFLVNTKKIRRCHDIKSSDRSKINFIWRSLEYLRNAGILELNGVHNSPKNYKIKLKEKIDIKNFISSIEKE